MGAALLIYSKIQIGVMMVSMSLTKVVTCDTSHKLMSGLHVSSSLNNSDMSVIKDVSHDSIPLHKIIVFNK